jgi:hypothetical protein
MKKTYYTKCFRKFEKSSTSDVTGYTVDPETDEECRDCPFRNEVKKGYPAVFDRWECRAGSEHPVDKNDWRGNADDKNSINVLSLDINFLTKVLEYCEENEDINGGYQASDEKDCRRSISISVSKNKKGLAAKRKFLSVFFPDAVPVTEDKFWNNTQLEKLEFLYKAGKTVNDLSEIFAKPVFEVAEALRNIDTIELHCELCKKPVPTFFELNFNPDTERYCCTECWDPSQIANSEADLFEQTDVEGKEEVVETAKSQPSTQELFDRVQLRERRKDDLKRINKEFVIGVDLADLTDEQWEKVCSNAENAKHTRKARGAMFNQEFKAELKSVSAKTYFVNRDGMKTKESSYKIVIETNDIDYDDLAKEAPYIHHLITHDAPMQFKSINFGEIPIKELSLRMSYYNEEGDTEEYSGNPIPNIKILNLSVVNRMQIPSYIFVLEIPKNVSGAMLLKNLKMPVIIELVKPRSLFDALDDVEISVKGV